MATSQSTQRSLKKDELPKDLLTPKDSVKPKSTVPADDQLNALRNPKDSFKTTWRDDKSQWKPQHYLLNFFYPAQVGAPPVHKKTDPIPVLAGWTADIWVIAFGAWPLAVQYLYGWATGTGLPPIAAFFLYWTAFLGNAAHAISMFERLGHKYGFLDGEVHRRDDVPDVGVIKAIVSLALTTIVRPMFTVALTYDRDATPLPTAWLPVELLLYSVVLDLFFYTYHRSCHEVSFLWQYHRTHHLTKHPNSFLSSYADHEQELLEIALIPIATWAVLKTVFGLPMTFHDWWYCHQTIVFAELLGHSGIRLQVGVPGVARHILQLFNADLIGEDHDLHHRKGYRKSNNYGKQTRLWDVIFGTCGPRYETKAENIDHSTQVSMPFF